MKNFSKKLVVFGIFLAMSGVCAAQNDSATVVMTQIVSLGEQLKTVQQQINKSDSVKSVDLQQQLNELIQKQSQKNDPDIEAQIASIKGELSTKQSTIEDLQKKVNDITSQITTLNNSLKEQSEAKQKAEELATKAKETNENLLHSQTGFFKSVILNFRDFSSLIDAVATTGQSVLLFPDKDKNDVWAEIGKWTGVVGSVVGAIVYASSDSKSTQNSGVITAGLSFSLTGALNLLTKKKNKYVENIARNIEFTDEINAFCLSSQLFKENSVKLYTEIMESFKEKTGKEEGEFSTDTEWRPSQSQLDKYLQLVYLRRDLSGVLRQMKAKAMLLKKDPNLTQEGTTTLTKLERNYTEALNAWETSESQYINNYKVLKESIDANKQK